MTKKRKYDAVIPAAGIHAQVDAYLYEIAVRTAAVQEILDEANAATQAVVARYNAQLEPLDALLKSAVMALEQTMKYNKKVLFADKDVVSLTYGTLLRTVDKKNLVFHGKKEDIIATLERLGVGFAEAVKVAKSYDRDIIREWPDDKIAQIGAERKPKEDFSYDLKKEK
jgi:phage host-nuclease inhibitor protein Gam